MSLIDVRDLRRTYQMGRTAVHALRGVTFQIDRAEFVALMGASGSGKSTLMHLLGCLDTPTGGAYRLEGREITRLSPRERATVRNRQIGFVFQGYNLLPRLNALENVALPLHYRGESRRVTERARAALERVGLAARADHRPTELSGGQQQRVAVARALVGEPRLILADEPTGNLDSESGRALMELLVALSGEGRTILIVTHDAKVAGYADRVMRMQDGRLDAGVAA